MSYQGIIFDFNGVLWWDTALQEQAWSQIAQELCGRPLTPVEISQHIHGRTNEHSFTTFLGRTPEKGELDRLIQRKESIYRQLCLDQGPGFRLSPGAIPLLDHLAACAIPHTVATASGKTNLDFFGQHLQLQTWFDPTAIVYDDGRLPGKPAPDCYLEAARRLGLAPVQCVVVEDSISGLAAANAANIGHVVALGPAPAHASLRRVGGVDRVISSLTELPLELFSGATAAPGR